MRIRLLFLQEVSGSAASRPASGEGTSPCRGDTPSGESGGWSQAAPSTASPIKQGCTHVSEKAFFETLQVVGAQGRDSDQRGWSDHR